MRRGLISFFGLLLGVLLLVPTAASAQQVGVDTASGSGVTGNGFFEFDFDVSSGPDGENPSGTVTLSVIGGLFQISGAPSCVAIDGNRAIIGVVGSGTGGLQGVVVTAVDGGGPGSGLDTFDAFPSFDGANVTCTPQIPSGGDTNVVSGDIIVEEAPPLPTSKQQCKNGGWRDFGIFKNQGDCISFVVSQGRKPPQR